MKRLAFNSTFLFFFFPPNFRVYCQLVVLEALEEGVCYGQCIFLAKLY